MIFGFIPPPYGLLWGDAKKLLEPAVKRGGNEWPEVIADLMQNKAQLWLAIDDRPVAAMVTRIDGRTLEVWLAGGAVLSGCVPFLERAIEASKAAGTTTGRITGRRGWDRVLSRFGWQRRGEDLVKDW